jgi:plastocyanin
MERHPAWGKCALAAGAALIAILPLTRAGAGEQTVEMKGLSFVPEEITVAVGDTVTWMNQDTDHHDTEGDGNDINSPDMAQGAKYSFTFPAAGRFEYHCRIHTYMRGTVIVGDGNGGAPPPTTQPPSTTTSSTKPPGPLDGLPLLPH